MSYFHVPAAVPAKKKRENRKRESLSNIKRETPSCPAEASSSASWSSWWPGTPCWPTTSCSFFSHRWVAVWGRRESPHPGCWWGSWWRRRGAICRPSPGCAWTCRGTGTPVAGQPCGAPCGARESRPAVENCLNSFKY